MIKALKNPKTYRIQLAPYWYQLRLLRASTARLTQISIIDFFLKLLSTQCPRGPTHPTTRSRSIKKRTIVLNLSVKYNTMIINPGVLAQLTVGNLAAGAVTATTSLWAANSPWSTANPNGPLATANTNTISSPKTTLILSSYSDCDPTLASSQPPAAALILQNPVIALPFPTSTPFSQPRPHCRSPTASLSSGFSSLLTMGWSTLTNVLFSLLLTLHINAWVSQAQSSPSNNVTADIDVDALCPGYTATNVQSSPTGDTLIADLVLAGPKCNAYGADLEKLRLHVVYESGKRKVFS